MPKIKYTARKMKTEKELPASRAVKEFKCTSCNRNFTQKSNFVRHLGLVHEIDEHSNLLPVAERLKLQRYNVKRQRGPKEVQLPKKKKATSVEFLPSSSSSSSPERPAIHAALGRPPSLPEAPLFVADEPGPAETIDITQDTDRELDSADEYFICVNVRDPNAPEEAEEEEGDEQTTVPVTSVETTVRSGSPLISPKAGRRPTRPKKYFRKEPKYSHYHPGAATHPEEDSSVNCYGQEENRENIYVAFSEARRQL